MKIMVIGSGARETALLQSLEKEGHHLFIISDRVNPSYPQMSAILEIKEELCNDSIVEFTLRHDPDVVIALSEQYIFNGLANKLEMLGFSCLFPKKELVFLEADKIQTQSLVSKIDPGVRPPLEKVDSFSLIKKKYSRGDKIVCITPLKTEVLSYEELVMKNEQYFENMWIDQYFEGIDVSIYALVCGNQLLFFPPIYDYPHLVQNGQRMKTGGMGALLLPDHERKISVIAESKCRDTMSKIVSHLSQRQLPFNGVLVGQFRVQHDQILFIEFDIRPGEPEFVNALSALKYSVTTSLILPFMNNEVKEDDALFHKDKASLSVCIAPHGYPSNGKSGFFEGKIESDNCSIYWNAAYLDKGGVIRHDSRRICTIYCEGDSAEQVKSDIKNLILTNGLDGKYVFSNDLLI